jgi:enamine deaminase RidA (YjgF/YER057c/UK114 family)
VGQVEDKLRGLGLELPPPPVIPPGAKANLKFAQRTGNLVYLSGMGPLRDGKVMVTGKVGAEVTVEQAYEAARLTTLNMLAVLKAEIGDLDKVTKWIKAIGFVNSAPGFTRQPEVLNGFSDLIAQLYGDMRGLHARSAVGMAELPFGIPVEIEAIVEI